MYSAAESANIPATRPMRMTAICALRESSSSMFDFGGSRTIGAFFRMGLGLERSG